jgi:hypothetical protein
MTWWGAVLGFVGALAGSWGGQFIATRREDRRWEREREREDLRWQRERQKVADERDHADRLHWRTERQQAYGKFVAGMAEWRNQLGAVLVDQVIRSEAAVSKDLRTKISHAEKVVDEHFEIMHLLGSAAVKHAMEEAMNVFHQYRNDVLNKRAYGFGSDQIIHSAYARMTSVIRAELGINEADSLTPTPPSAETS